MGKGEERAHGAPEGHDSQEPASDEAKCIFEQPATLREPAAPRVPRVMRPSAVSVIPLAGEEQSRTAEAPLATLQEAREATDALLHEILEEDLPAASREATAGASEPERGGRRAPPPREEDWPAELHSLPLQEE